MAVITGDQTACLQEIGQIRELSSHVSTSLNNLHKLLQIRSLSLSPDLLDRATSLNEALNTLESYVRSDETELEQLRALTETSALINSSLDPHSILAQAMDEIINLTGAERGYILLKNAAGELEFSICREPETSQTNGADISRTVLRQVTETGKALLTDNAASDPRMAGSETVAKYELRSIMCVPLTYKDTITGAIYVDNRFREAVFTERELNLLTAFANQTAIAFENAILFARVQDTLREITQVKELMENVFASIASGVITSGAEDRVIMFNRAASQILATAPEAALNQPLHNLLPRIADFDLQLRAVREHNQSSVFEAHTTIPERGNAILNLKLSPLKNAALETQGVAVVLDDLTEQREREETLELMTRYLPPGMVANIGQIAGLALGGERREVTSMFVYACPYAELSATVRPPQMMEMLNAYLETATDAIHSARGIIDKYMGNELMVLFNTQLNPDDDHAYCAILAALDLRDAFVKLYGRLGINPQPHLYRIGLHTGVATLGNVGSINRRSFTAIGDTINLSKRLQENAKPGQIIVSEDTVEHIRAYHPTLDGLDFQELQAIQVKGRKQETRIYEVFRANHA
ncbi:MAG TPA: adenylate/guanylate cyclase domain-containing protein [Phototrophicaceae bacterium]|nr:adenylate/guanylate cyclase domain-containing protein [Phototrophicaceae bacterium]